VPSRQSCSERLAPLLFGAVLIVAVIVVSRALLSILESIYILLGENVAEIIIADVDHDLLNTTGVLWEF
jgi:hypothetical protein